MSGQGHRFSPYFDRSFKRKESEYVRNATRKGRLVLEDLKPIMRLNCVYCGEPAAPQRPNGVDRVDNGGDYMRGNCVPACTMCNFMKGRLHVADFLNHVIKIANNVHNARLEVSRTVGKREDSVYSD